MIEKPNPSVTFQPRQNVPEPSIGTYVRDRRTAHKMTQRQLAELAGVGVRFLSELERDKATLRMDAVNAVLAVFGKRLGVVDRERDDGSEPTS